jgi:hypothetical protein
MNLGFTCKGPGLSQQIDRPACKPRTAYVAAQSEPLPFPCSQIMQVRLHALGKQHAATAAELAAVERQLEPYGGLPADVAEAEAAIQAKRGELARLRQRLQTNLEGME